MYHIPYTQKSEIMKKSSLFTSLAVIASLAIPIATSNAAIVGTYDQNDTITAIYGGGNPDTGWVSAEGGGAQVALRAHQQYLVYAGLTPSPNYTFWTGTEISLDFSFAVNEAGVGSDNLDDFDFFLYYDTDPGPLVNFSSAIAVKASAPVGFGNDNSYGTSGTANGAGQEGPAFLPTATIGQNSQKPQWFGGPTFLTEGEYAFAIEAVKPAIPNVAPAITVARAEISITAVPEPSGAMLLGLTALGLISRRKRK